MTGKDAVVRAFARRVPEEDVAVHAARSDEGACRIKASAEDFAGVAY